jgi:hypothetical protein
MEINNLNEFVGHAGIQSVNETDYFYEFLLEEDRKILIHKKLTGDKAIIETNNNAIMVDPNELNSIKSILENLNKV